MIIKKKIKPRDFTFNDDKTHLVFKSDALKFVLKKFLKTLEPLQVKSIDIIRNVEKMLRE